MTTTLARLASVPQASAMPERVELIHCQTAGRIVGIRLDCGALFRVEPDNRSDYVPLNASESAVPYTLTTAAEVERTEAVENLRAEAIHVAVGDVLAENDRLRQQVRELGAEPIA